MEIAHLQSVNQLKSWTNESTEKLRIRALPHCLFDFEHASQITTDAWRTLTSSLNVSTNESMEKLRHHVMLIGMQLIVGL